MQRNGVMECTACRSRLVAPSPRSVSRAYDKHHNKITSKFRALKFLLVVGDCMLVGLQVCFYLSVTIIELLRSHQLNPSRGANTCEMVFRHDPRRTIVRQCLHASVSWP
uniref:Uncharacterized protein n=1 Tax=Aegilops tauschii subsp. strangulata TaxID=200361 RepID=A0A453P199_AEGTS